MYTKLNLKLNSTSQRSTLLAVLLLPIILGGCSSLLSTSRQGETFELLPADDMKQGPGVFSGEKGAFYVVGGDKNAPQQTEVSQSYNTKSISDMDLNETSKVLDNKIRQLQRDQMELELLKLEVDKKLKN